MILNMQDQSSVLSGAAQGQSSLLFSYVLFFVLRVFQADGTDLPVSQVPQQQQCHLKCQGADGGGFHNHDGEAHG